MECLLTTLCSTALALAAPSGVQPDQEVGPRVSERPIAEPPGAGPGDIRADQQPTAEELLRALQRARSFSDVIPPASAAGGAAQAKPKATLLPEGFAIVGRAGRLEQSGEWWTFIADPSPETPPIKLLPNANLEVMIRTARGASLPVTFVVSGEVTVFEDENYLLVRLVRRSTTTAVAPPGSQEGPAGQSAAAEKSGALTPRPDAKSAPSDGALPADAPVEDVLSALRRQQPTATAMPVAPLQRETGPRRGAAAVQSVMSDGAPVMHRPGRLVRDGNWWTFVFESDHLDSPEPPMKLLPNQSVELMVRASARRSSGLVFLVSGEVTLFDGENYLLPRVAMRRIDSGNTRK